MNYTNLAMTTAVIVAVSAEAKDLATNKKLSGKPVIASFALGIFLFIFGMASESVATKFCYLVIVTAVLANGGPLFKALTPQPPKG